MFAVVVILTQLNVMVRFVVWEFTVRLHSVAFTLSLCGEVNCTVSCIAGGIEVGVGAETLPRRGRMWSHAFFPCGRLEIFPAARNQYLP